MGRQFSISTVFRMTDKKLVKELFERFGGATDRLNWDEVTQNNPKPLIKLRDMLGVDERNRFECVLKDVHALACAEGMQAIREATGESPTKELQTILALKGNYTKVLYLYLHWSKLFQLALTHLSLIQINWTSKMIGLPKVKPLFGEEVVSLLESDIEDICSDYGDKGTVCTVECFENNDVYYYYAWPDDHPEDILVHDPDRLLIHQIIRKTFTIAFAYDARNGVCRVSAKGSTELRERLTDQFLIVVLGRLPRKTTIPPFNLSIFLHPHFKLAGEPHEGMEVEARRITLSLAGKNRIALNLQQKPSIREELNHCLHDRYMTNHELRVEEVTLSFTFRAPDGRRMKTVTFSLREHQSTLKNECDEYVSRIERFLLKRNIANEERSSVPVKPFHSDRVCIK